MGEYVPGPNQEFVRGSPPPAAAPETTDLESMTKAQLLEYAAENDVQVEDTMTKAEIRAAINGDD